MYKQFTVVVSWIKSGTRVREDITVQARDKVEAVYLAKQKFLETHATSPTIVGIRK